MTAYVVSCHMPDSYPGRYIKSLGGAEWWSTRNDIIKAMRNGDSFWILRNGEEIEVIEVDQGMHESVLSTRGQHPPLPPYVLMDLPLCARVD